MSTLDRLEDLHRDATPGPWGCDEQALPEIAPFCLDEDEPGSGELILDWSREIAATVSSRTDAELIVEVRNALPALLTIARAAQEAGNRARNAEAELGAVQAALRDQIAMNKQSLETLRDLHANLDLRLDEQTPDGEPLVPNILFWLIEDLDPSESEAALAGVVGGDLPTEQTETGGDIRRPSGGEPDVHG